MSVGAFLSKNNGICTNDALIVGVGKASREEGVMIIALIGLEPGIIEQGMQVILVLMVSLITLITLIMCVNWSFRGEYTTNNPNRTCITKGK